MEPTTLFLAIGTLCTALAAAGGLFAFWNNLLAKITTNKITAEAALSSASAASTRIDTVARESADAREATARNIGRLEAANEGLVKAVEGSERRLAEALDAFSERFEHLSNRLDGVIDRIVGITAQEPNP